MGQAIAGEDTTMVGCYKLYDKADIMLNMWDGRRMVHGFPAYCEPELDISDYYVINKTRLPCPGYYASS
jgi:hypothetical protein